jgi:hypothetical protein
LKFIYGNKNELDPRVMPSTKKTEKNWQKTAFVQQSLSLPF